MFEALALENRSQLDSQIHAKVIKQSDFYFFNYQRPRNAR
jgi:hypothetical protein